MAPPSPLLAFVVDATAGEDRSQLPCIHHKVTSESYRGMEAITVFFMMNSRVEEDRFRGRFHRSIFG